MINHACCGRHAWDHWQLQQHSAESCKTKTMENCMMKVHASTMHKSPKPNQNWKNANGIENNKVKFHNWHMCVCVHNFDVQQDLLCFAKNLLSMGAQQPTDSICTQTEENKTWQCFSKKTENWRWQNAKWLARRMAPPRLTEIVTLTCLNHGHISPWQLCCCWWLDTNDEKTSCWSVLVSSKRSTKNLWPRWLSTCFEKNATEQETEIQCLLDTLMNHVRNDLQFWHVFKTQFLWFHLFQMTTSSNGKQMSQCQNDC